MPHTKIPSTHILGTPVSDRNSMTVNSGGARKRIGGPHVPVPRLTYSHVFSPTHDKPVLAGYINLVNKVNGKIWPPCV